MSKKKDGFFFTIFQKGKDTSGSLIECRAPWGISQRTHDYICQRAAKLAKELDLSVVIAAQLEKDADNNPMLVFIFRNKSVAGIELPELMIDGESYYCKDEVSEKLIEKVAQSQASLDDLRKADYLQQYEDALEQRKVTLAEWQAKLDSFNDGTLASSPILNKDLESASGRYH
jgi:hypothetical protein